MKKIGEGLQYNAYEISNNRVRKIPQSNESISVKIKAWLDRDLKLQKEIPSYEEKYNQTLDERHNSFFHIKQLSERYPELNKYLGNPTFFDNYEVEQDKVILLRDILNDINGDFSFQCRIIDQFIDLIILSWKYGFSDRVFNFTENSGIDKENNVIIIDFGEIVYEKEKVKELIHIKRWEKSWSFRKDFCIEKVKNYYLEEIEKKLTIENLEKYWRINL